MSAQREVIKANWLQHKVRKKSGTLIRKKKIRYEEAEWVVLCVHDDRIPLLEWYFSEECSQAHRPSKVIDLLDSAFVTPVISDSRSFIIGFTHSSREPIELAALTPQDCSDWVHISMATLVRLRCINDSLNVYTALPDSIPMIYSNSVEEHPLEFSLDDEVPHSPAPAPPQEPDSGVVSAYEHLTLAVDFCKLDTSEQNRSSECAAAEVSERARTMRRKSSCGRDIPPPLPPRDSTLPSSPLITSSRAGSVYDFPRNCVTPSKGMYGTLERHRHLSIASPTPASPSTHSTTNSEYGLLADAGSILSKEIAPPESEARVNVKRGYSIPSSAVVGPRGRRLSENVGCTDVSGSLKNNGYDVPLSVTGTDHFRLSSLVAPPEGVGSTSDTSSAASPPTLKSSQQSLDNVYATPLGAHLKQLTPIALQLMLCVESVAFVEISNRIWVAGWTASGDKHLAGVLRVGDELVEVGGVKVEDIGQLPGLFYSSSTPGSPVNLSIRRIPYGTEYTLIKTSRNYDLGIILRKHKNKLESVREGSAAFQAGVRAHIIGMHGAISSACVTHFNSRPLSLFSKNDELLNLIETVPPMSEFTLIIQPYDFMKEIKREIKKMKNYGAFI